MSFHYFLSCDRCDRREPNWDSVPDDWITVRPGHHERERHFCPACYEVLKRYIVKDGDGG